MSQRSFSDLEYSARRKQTRRDRGMNAHVGADVVTGLVHTVKGTAANVSDVS